MWKRDLLPQEMWKISKVVGQLINISMRHLFWLCTLLMLVGCNEEKIETISTSSQEEFYAIIEGADSRTYLDERRRLRWHEKDSVTLFRKNTYNRTYMFTGKTGANAGGFKQVSTDDEFWYGATMNYNYAVYPHSVDITLDETDSVLIVNMPEKQIYSEKSFGVGANTMVSISEDNQLIFKNVGSYLCVRLSGNNTDISSITMTAKGDLTISGEAKITPVLDGVPTCEMTGDGKSILLTCSTPVTISSDPEVPTEFWIVVPPVQLSEGFSVTVTNSENNSQTFDVDKSFTFERNLYYTLTREVNITNGDGDKEEEKEEDEEDVVIPTSGTPYLTFSAANPQTLTMSQATTGLEYSLNDSEWTELGTSTITFGADKGDLKLRGKNIYGTAIDLYNYSSIVFGNTTPVACTGDIRGLLDYENHTTVSTESARFVYLFKDCANLISAPLLPATELASASYYGMFDGCTSLASAPQLPATTLAANCYSYMFNNCSSLTAGPVLLPATTLAKECYQSMFYNCKNLESAPELPATILTESCYSSMFSGCSNLTIAPQLPATAVAKKCYSSMFSYCTNLTVAPSILPATTLAADCYQNMFNSCIMLTTVPQLPATVLAENCYKTMFLGCESLLTPPELPATTLAKSCYAEMFSNCIKIVQTPELPAVTLADNCYESMFYNCIGLTTASQLPAITLNNNCYKRMFYNCINLNSTPALPAKALKVGCYYEMFFKCKQLSAAPELPAQILTTNCYYNMFNLCSSLQSITMLATDISASNCLVNWVNGVHSIGTFTKAKTMESLLDGVNGIPENWEVVNYGE